MKKISSFFAGLFFLLLSLNVGAQEKKGADYFAGKWSVMVKGTPNGDAKMFFVLEKKDSMLIGVVQDSTGKEMSKLSKVELNAAGNIAIAYFNANGYDVNLEMNKKDDDHFSGSIMGMFDADGERVKTTK